MEGCRRRERCQNTGLRTAGGPVGARVRNLSAAGQTGCKNGTFVPPDQHRTLQRLTDIACPFDRSHDAPDIPSSRPLCADPMLQPHSTHLASQAFQSAAHMPQPHLLVLSRLVSALPAPVDAAATGVLTVCRPTIRCVAPPYLFLSHYQFRTTSAGPAANCKLAAAQRMRRNASSKHGVWCCISNMHTAASLGTGEGSRPPGHQNENGQGSSQLARIRSGLQRGLRSVVPVVRRRLCFTRVCMQARLEDG